MNPTLIYFATTFLMYTALGICIGLIMLMFIRPSNYIQDLAEDIKSDLDIDINKTSNE